MRNQEEKIELQKNIHRKMCVRGINFWAACSTLYVSLLLFSSTPSLFPRRTFRIIPIKCIFLCVLFCGISWVNTQKYGNLLQFNTTRFFYKQRFFFNSAQCCLAFSRTELQMLLRYCLIYIYIYICIYIYIQKSLYILYFSIYVAISRPRPIYVINNIISLKQTHFFFVYF